MFNFIHTYKSLSDFFFKNQLPQTYDNPELALFNYELAEELNLNIKTISTKELAHFFSGTKLFNNSEPIAQAYAGHQFGHFTMLGDGRAILLGEHKLTTNKLVDIQLKGAGITPYSRRGDGKAALKAMLREYLISESMHYLGIPTSRSLAVIKTNAPVYREKIEQGAVLTRVAASHIRVGTFEYARYFGEKKQVIELVEYTVNRHYPHLKVEKNVALYLLKQLIDEQIKLVCNWIRVGFVHGVMNTDNTTISGETIDYGPCAFMNEYNLDTVFSSIDEQGRYAFGNQGKIIYWNLCRLAEALLPAIADDEKEAIDLCTNVLSNFPELYYSNWLIMYGNKFGFKYCMKGSGEEIFVKEFLSFLRQHNLDYTQSFLMLQESVPSLNENYSTTLFRDLKSKWKQLLLNQNISLEVTLEKMKLCNPIYIPRNHLVEEALEKATNNNDYSAFTNLLAKLKKQYDLEKNYSELIELSPKNFEGYVTYCGT